MTTTPNNAPDNPPDNTDLLDTLKITKVAKRAVPGSWVTGTIAGHKFEALVFPEPAVNPDYELPGSNISKFWLADNRGNVVAEFDRGWNREPSTEMARRITDLLAAGLAETVYSPVPKPPIDTYARRERDIARLVDLLRIELAQHSEEADDAPDRIYRTVELRKVRNDLIDLVCFISKTNRAAVQKHLRSRPI